MQEDDVVGRDLRPGEVGGIAHEDDVVGLHLRPGGGGKALLKRTT